MILVVLNAYIHKFFDRFTILIIVHEPDQKLVPFRGTSDEWYHMKAYGLYFSEMCDNLARGTALTWLSRVKGQKVGHFRGQEIIFLFSISPSVFVQRTSNLQRISIIHLTSGVQLDFTTGQILAYKMRGQRSTFDTNFEMAQLLFFTGYMQFGFRVLNLHFLKEQEVSYLTMSLLAAYRVTFILEQGQRSLGAMQENQQISGKTEQTCEMLQCSQLPSLEYLHMRLKVR